MNVSRLLIKTSDDVPNLHTMGELGFVRAIARYERQCFDDNRRFDHAIWGSWNAMNWSYRGYRQSATGYMERSADTHGTIPGFVNRVTGGAHGRVDFATFACAYLGGPHFMAGGPVLSEVSSPFFAVVDHNSAHHVALPLILKSQRALANRRPLVVINFDAHTDHAAVQGFDQITCQNWSTLLLRRTGRPRWLAGSTISRYVVFGLKAFGATERAKSWTSDGQTADSRERELQPGNARLPAHVLRYLLGNMEGKVAYITIDRDFTHGSATPYGHGSYDPVEGRAMVRDCVEYLRRRNVPLLGFDVHGLPTGLVSEATMRQAYDDIKFFDNLVQGY